MTLLKMPILIDNNIVLIRATVGLTFRKKRVRLLAEDKKQVRESGPN